MPISDLMTSKLITVSPEQSLRDIEPLFAQYRIHHLLVVQQDKLVGLVSDRDLLKNLSPFVHTSAADAKDNFLLNRKVSQIMSQNLITIEPEAGIRDACSLLLDKKVSLLPVVKKGVLLGVVSWKDILRYFIA